MSAHTGSTARSSSGAAAAADASAGGAVGAAAEARGAHAVNPRYTVQSLVVGLRVLEALAKRGEPRGVTELARDIGASKWVIFRHLQTLRSEGFAVQDPGTDKYELGPRLYALKDALHDRFPWAHKAREEMIRLRQEVGYTVSVASPLEDWSGVAIIDVLGGTQDVQFTLKIGAVFEFHTSAHGKTTLAFGDQALLERTIARGLKPRTPKTIVSPEALRREIKRVRKQGWAMAPEQADLGMNALTAPIFSSQGRFEGSIGVFGSLEQIGPNPPEPLVRAVVQAARRISQRLWSK